tara:strand:- start:745 stop:927 length:183 start_codon:yes stop_codon:yes gene_type:complete
MGIPKNSINTPLELTKEEILEKLNKLVEENERIKQNNLDNKLQLIESRTKLQQILEILNK